MLKKNEKYPIEVALEKAIHRVSLTVVWGIKSIVKFFWIIPKKKDDKVIYKLETVLWLLIGILALIRSIIGARLYW